MEMPFKLKYLQCEPSISVVTANWCDHLLGVVRTDEAVGDVRNVESYTRGYKISSVAGRGDVSMYET